MKELPQSGATEREVSTAINELIRGNSNAVGALELTTGTSTTVTVRRMTAQSVVVLTPTSASAAGLAVHVTPQAGQFVVTHPAGSAGRTFGYIVLG